MNSPRFLSLSILMVLAGCVGGCSSDDPADDGAGAGGTSTSSGGNSSGGTTSPSGGTGGASAGAAGTPATKPEGLPADDSKAVLGAFIQSGAYKQSPWIAQTDAPREETGGSQHGSKVRLWMNPSYVTSLRNGRDAGKDRTTNMVRPYPDQWAMVVKEIYDAEGTTLEGVGAIYRARATTDVNSITFYCWGEGARCASGAIGTKEQPIYGVGTATGQCHFCHSPGTSLFYSLPPAQ